MSPGARSGCRFGERLLLARTRTEGTAQAIGGPLGISGPAGAAIWTRSDSREHRDIVARSRLGQDFDCRVVVPMHVQIAVDPLPSEQDLGALWEAAWGGRPASFAQVLSRSLGHVGAYDGARLIGFVNIAWDGGVHAFILDTCVHPDYRRQGIATKLVIRAISIARERGAHWLHVDFEPHLLEFYRRCGFRHTDAGLLRL
jgi:GNAT superfamily N-acetyltransferase